MEMPLHAVRGEKSYNLPIPVCLRICIHPVSAKKSNKCISKIKNAPKLELITYRSKKRIHKNESNDKIPMHMLNFRLCDTGPIGASHRACSQQGNRDCAKDGGRASPLMGMLQ